MKRLAVLTSGGDAPGMNAAVRAIVRRGAAAGIETWGVTQGYAGLLRGDFVALGPRNVGGIIDRGGTFLGSSRCEEMRSAAGPALAVRRLQEADIAGLIVIGGNGSQLGALALVAHGFPVVGIASTIDNDLAGTDISIGATTALETAVGCIDRLRVTASSHRRAFLVEVMGRHSGYLALQAGIASGAEAIVLPEVETSVSTLAEALLAAEQRGKKHAIVVVAEGARLNAEAIASAFSEQHAALGFELRVSKLGHIQRGGAPCVFDRLIATRLGAAAVERYLEGEHAALMGIVSGQVTCAPLSIARNEKRLDLSVLQLADIMAR